MKFKIKYKILLLYTIVSLCIIVTIGFIISSNLREDKFADILGNLQNQLAHIDFSITSFFQEVEYDLLNLASLDVVATKNDKDFTTFIEADERTFEYNIGETERKIIDLFWKHKDSHKYVNSVYMGRKNGSFVRSHKRNRATKYDPRNRPWYQLAVENPGRTMRTSPYSSITSTDVNIGVVRALLDEHNRAYGVLGMDITLENLKKYIEQIKVEHNGYLLLLDNESTILASRDKSHLFQNIFEIYKDKFEIFKTDSEGYTVFFDNNKRKYLIYHRSPILDWTIAFVITAERIDKEVRYFVYKIVLALLLSLLFLSVLTILGLEVVVIQPLSIVNTSTQLIAETGDLDHRVQYQSRDEIGSLAKSFNKMTVDLIRYIKKLSDSIAAKERMDSELKIAHEIQMGILPKEFPLFPGKYQIDIHAALEPAKQVGGDLYDFFFTKEDQLYFTIGDVAGKGVAAAVFMSAVKALIKATAKTINRPEDILRLVNTELSIGNDHGTFVTVFLGVLNIKTGEISYVNAGHNPPLILQQDGEVTFLESEKNIALGLNEDFIFRSNRYTLRYGESIFLYTDGVTEAFNKRDELYSAERLQKELSNSNQDSAKDIVSSILKSVKSFSTDVPQSDDITIFALRYMYENK